MDRRHHLARPSLLALLAGLAGCTHWMREPEFFSEQLYDQLDARAEAIEACYDRYLEEVDPAAKGSLTVDFVVEAKTGAFADVTVDPEATTVPDVLAACVTAEVEAMTLDPVDTNTAEATFTWEFSLGSRKQRPADPFAGVQPMLLGCYEAHLREVDREAEGTLAIDYAFDEATGEVATLEVIGEQTSAPAPVVECAAGVLKGAKLDPAQLERRNVAGQRVFTLRYTPYAEAGA